ncbi:hypothetical protein BB560_006803 [Smittium megazygosporum]|uniref:SCP domain-containing protein n=1 Tax=Smittium megazygosporum TaxID=133381 RepID=A0A2T9Y1E0_9FUNG|nr:hypothetical protein BB560_006803 [Smittium megazygosporum]
MAGKRIHRDISVQAAPVASTTSAAPSTPTTSSPSADNSQNRAGNYGQISDSDAQQLLSLVNDARAQNGLGALTMDTGLVAAALAQCNYQNSINTMTHDNSNYSGLLDRFAASGATCNGGCAENVAQGASSSTDAFNMWMNSPGHRANILGSSYTRMGYASVNGFWTQTFNGQT